ncbi:hypothetical protein VTN02DRAFT_1670 [Thermoascus thermophilus]
MPALRELGSVLDVSICCTWQAARSALHWPCQTVHRQGQTAIGRSTTTAAVLDNNNACLRSARCHPLRRHGGERADGSGASSRFHEIGGSAAALPVPLLPFFPGPSERLPAAAPTHPSCLCPLHRSQPVSRRFERAWSPFTPPPAPSAPGSATPQPSPVRLRPLEGVSPGHVGLYALISHGYRPRWRAKTSRRLDDNPIWPVRP